MAAKKYPETVPKSPELPPLSQHCILKPSRIWDQLLLSRFQDQRKEGTNPKCWLQLDSCHQTKGCEPLLTHQWEAPPHSLSTWFVEVGSPQPRRGTGRSAPAAGWGTRVASAAPGSAAPLHLQTAQDTAHQMQNQNTAMLKTTKNPLNQNPTSQRKAQMKSNSFPAPPQDSIPTSPTSSVRASPSLVTIPSRHAKSCPTFGILTLPTPWETIPAQNYSPETGTSASQQRFRKERNMFEFVQQALGFIRELPEEVLLQAGKLN